MRFAGSPQIASFLSDGPDYGAVADLSMKARSNEKQTATAAIGKVNAAGLDAMAQVRAAEHKARGIEAGYQTQAATTRANGMSNMFGSIAGGIGKLDFSGGGSSSGLSIGSPSTFGGGNLFSGNNYSFGDYL